MSIKVPNKKHPAHPLMQYKKYMKEVKNSLNDMNDRQLIRYCEERRLDDEPHRTAYLRSAIAWHEVKFETTWEDKHGWPFKDCNNGFIFTQHLVDEEQKRRNEQTKQNTLLGKVKRKLRKMLD